MAAAARRAGVELRVAGPGAVQALTLPSFSAATFIEPMEGYILRMLWALAVDGIIPEDACHDPSGPALDRDQRDRVASVMRALDGVS